MSLRVTSIRISDRALYANWTLLVEGLLSAQDVHSSSETVFGECEMGGKMGKVGEVGSMSGSFRFC